MEKTAKVKVAFEGTDRRNEFRMEMPGGWLATLHCNGKWNLMSPELLELINKYQYGRYGKDASSDRWYPHRDRGWASQAKHEEVVTYSLMRELMRLAAADMKALHHLGLK